MADIFSRKRNVVFIAVFYTFLWGCCFPLVKLCMEGFGATDNMSKCLVAGLRFTLAGLVLVIFSLIKDKKEGIAKKKELPFLLGYGMLATALQYAFTYIGLSNVDGAKGAIFDQLGVFIIIILAGLLLKNDRLSTWKLIGSAVGLLGILAVNTEKMSLSFSLDGELMMTAAAFCQAGAYFVAIACTSKVKATRLVGYGQLFGGVILTAFSLAMGGRLTQLSLGGIASLLALALFAAVAYVLSLMPLKYFPASEISVFNLLITVFGVVMSGLVLGENVLKVNYLVSLALIIAGIMLVNKKGTRRQRKNKI